MWHVVEAAANLAKYKGPCLDGYVRHVSEHSVLDLENALDALGNWEEWDEDDESL
jgi:hypothetical protein